MKRWKVNCPRCGTLMYTTTQEPKLGTLLLAERATLPDGTKPLSGEKVTCPKCGISPRPMIEHVEEIP